MSCLFRLGMPLGYRLFLVTSKKDNLQNGVSIITLHKVLGKEDLAVLQKVRLRNDIHIHRPVT